MSRLHLVSSGDLTACWLRRQPEDALLLLGDAVHIALDPRLSGPTAAGDVYVAADDFHGRQLPVSALPRQVQLVTPTAIVKLIATHHPIIPWGSVS